MATTPGNAINESTTGITGFTGTAFTGTAMSANQLVAGGATSSTLQNIAGGAATSTVLIGNGVSTLPSFSATPQLTALGIGAAAGASGLTFDGTNLLANYATGTWTPGIAFGGGTTGITYSSQVGYYTRIGNVVHISLIVSLSNKGSSSGQATVTGLPFTTGAHSNTAVVSTFNSNITYTGFNAVVLQFNNSATTMGVIVSISGGAASPVSDTSFANTSAIVGSGFYIIA